MKSILSLTPGLALCAGLLLGAQAVSASTVEYHISLNTAALIGNASAPFSLDFQLNDGSGLGDANNTAIVNDFVFGSGSATGSANLFGGATGNLSGAVTLTDSSAFNEFYQTFNAGSTLSFDVTLTQNSDAGPRPDAFAFAILDNSLNNLPTSGVGDTYLLVNLGPTPSVTTGSSTSPLATITVTPVPEPASVVLIPLGLLAFILQRRNAANLRG